MNELFINYRGNRKRIGRFTNKVTAVKNAVMFLKTKFNLSELELVEFILVEDDKVTYSDGYINEVIFISPVVDIADTN